MDKLEFLKLCEKFKSNFEFAKKFKNTFINEIKNQEWLMVILKNKNISPENLIENLFYDSHSSHNKSTENKNDKIKKSSSKLKMSSTTIYYGEIQCQNINKAGKECTNNAYYEKDGKYLCGVHARKGSNRKELKKNPNAAERKEKLYKEEYRIVEEKAQENLENKRKGQIVCSKLRMLKQPDNILGFLKVFPNFKHQNRKDGYGCASLSPKSIGPIQMYDMEAKTIENFHQGNKIFRSETDRKKPGKEYKVFSRSKNAFINMYICDSFFETQKEMFQDDVPHRHKINIDHKNDKAIGTLWTNNKGQLCIFSYLECRQFYCVYYERFVKDLEDFIHLKNLNDNGFNLQIIGYDGYDPGNYSYESMVKCYTDTSRPFGHEMVLTCMLLGMAPWEEFVTEKF